MLRPHLLLRPGLQSRLYTSYGRSAGPQGPKRVLVTMLGLNTAVFVAWKYADNTIPVDLKSCFSPDTYRKIAQYATLDKTQLLRKLSDHFILMSNDGSRGRWWTQITASFSHYNLAHFAFNMFALHSFGNALIAYLPGMSGLRFAALCLGSGLSGSLGFLLHARSRKDRGEMGALGASGTVMGVATACALNSPFAQWQFMFIPVGIPAWAMLLGYFAYGTYFLDSRDSVVSHSGHLGGAVFGAAYYWVVLRRFGIRY